MERYGRGSLCLARLFLKSALPPTDFQLPGGHRAARRTARTAAYGDVLWIRGPVDLQTVPAATIVDQGADQLTCRCDVGTQGSRSAGAGRLDP